MKWMNKWHNNIFQTCFFDENWMDEIGTMHLHFINHPHQGVSVVSNCLPALNAAYSFWPKAMPEGQCRIIWLQSISLPLLYCCFYCRTRPDSECPALLTPLEESTKILAAQSELGYTQPYPGRIYIICISNIHIEKFNDIWNSYVVHKYLGCWSGFNSSLLSADSSLLSADTSRTADWFDWQGLCGWGCRNALNFCFTFPWGSSCCMLGQYANTYFTMQLTNQGFFNPMG